MSTNNKWQALSMKDRAFLIREAVRNGITDIDSIRNTWEHRFDGESDQSVRIPSIIVTPDKQYNEYVNTLPDNQRNTPESEYRTHRAWELFGKPENFKQAVELGLYNWDNSDKSYHGNSVAYDRENDTYEFLKPKHHETVQYELDWFHKGLETLEGGRQRKLRGKKKKEWEDFTSKYQFDDSGEFYRYIPKKLEK